MFFIDFSSSLRRKTRNVMSAYLYAQTIIKNKRCNFYDTASFRNMSMKKNIYSLGYTRSETGGHLCNTSRIRN
jgi:hypothetical protein